MGPFMQKCPCQLPREIEGVPGALSLDCCDECLDGMVPTEAGYDMVRLLDWKLLVEGRAIERASRRVQK
jgi:hypothetical protein